jgi:hypothetical protein|tara:strand:+ start:73 stop:288 length:216 start_codon:yes stop_codon:yes gene_type:complete
MGTLLRLFVGPLVSLLTKALATLGVYMAGRSSMEKEQLQAENEVLKQHAEIDRTHAGVDDAYDWMRDNNSR